MTKKRSTKYFEEKLLGIIAPNMMRKSVHHKKALSSKKSVCERENSLIS